LRFTGLSRKEPRPSEGGVPGLDLAVEDPAREGEASDRRPCIDLADATFEGSVAGFFVSGTRSKRIVGVAFATLNVLLLKRFMIRNVK
jgi:hypothetical protein